MRRITHALLASLVALVALTALAACGGSSSSAADKALPKVSGGDFGSKPTVKSTGAQLTALTKKVLKAGKGAEVKKGDLLVADYLGQTWRNDKVFDNSYDRGQPAAFPIGVGQVVKGWDDTLVGLKIGSRVLLVIPPDKGYGTSGNTQAGIKGDDTLVFVVDIVATYAKDAALTDATSVTPAAGQPKVTGALGAKPSVVVPKGTVPPKAASVTVLSRGTGPAVTDGELAVVEYEAVSWAGKAVDSTWGRVPQGFAISSQNPGPFLKLVGVPVGSRVLLLLPPQQGGKAATDSLAVAVDIVAVHGSSAK